MLYIPLYIIFYHTISYTTILCHILSYCIILCYIDLLKRKGREGKGYVYVVCVVESFGSFSSRGTCFSCSVAVMLWLVVGRCVVSKKQEVRNKKQKP